MLAHQSCQIGIFSVLPLLNISFIFLMGLERFMPGIEYTMRKAEKKKANAVKGKIEANNK